MTSIRMALTELRRLTATRMSRLAVVALVLVPTIYAGLYLFANHDPYDGLDRVPAALVVLDQGATGPDDKPVDVGRRVADQLLAAHDFDWHEVAEASAERGVRDGSYDFALTIPADFSASLTSSARFDPEQARLRMTTNDANSYLSSTIAGTVTDKVRDALAEEVGVDAAEQFLLGFGQIKTSLQQASSGAARLQRGLADASDGVRRAHQGSAKLATGAGDLADGLLQLKTSADPLPDRVRQLANGAARVADGNAEVAAIGDDVAGAGDQVLRRYRATRQDLVRQMEDAGLSKREQRSVLAVYDDLEAPLTRANGVIQHGSDQLDDLSTGARRVANGTDRLADAMPGLADAVDSARAGSLQVARGARQTRNGLGQLQRGTDRLHRGGRTLHDQLAKGAREVPSVDDELRQRMAQTIGDPVAIDNVAQARAGSYGAGLAPLFIALAAWIGGYVLFLLVRPLSRRALAANQGAVRTALAGWITPALAGAAQMALVLLVVLLAVDIVPANVLGTLLFMMLTSACFIAIMHALNAWFGTTGQFLGLVLMVLQLVTSGGTFPWQTIPTPLHWLHHLLPMTYAVDGLRQLMYGGLSDLVVRDVLVLVLWFVGALAVTSLAARRQRTWSVRRVRPELTLG